MVLRIVWVYDFARGFLDSIIESLVIKLELAIEQNPDIKSLFVGGGVFNSEEIVRNWSCSKGVWFRIYVYPKGEYRGDNAGMVGIAGITR